MTEKINFPSDPSHVYIGGLLAQWDESSGRYVLSERIDEDTWTSVGYVFTTRDAQRMVDGWIS